jgi:hypothetical protein
MFSAYANWLVARGCFIFITALFIVTASVALAHSPPPGIDWKEDLPAGKLEAASRKLPIMMYVADDNAGSKAMTASLQDPKVTRMLRHFVCVFVSRSHKLPNFQRSYVPWIAATPQTTFQPPLLVFGDSAGNAKQEYRIEGKSLGATELLAHLEKVLKALAPDEAKKATGQGLKSMNLGEFCERLDISVTFLENNLVKEKLILFLQEVSSALETCKYLKPKLRKIKDKEKRKEATGHFKKLENSLKKLAKYRGKEKDDEKYEGYLKEAREALESLATAVKSIKIETDTLTCRAVPRNKKPSSQDDLKSELEKLDYVTKVSLEETEETVKVQGEEFKITVFTITCEKGKASKSKIERLFKKSGYLAKWKKADK